MNMNVVFAGYIVILVVDTSLICLCFAILSLPVKTILIFKAKFSWHRSGGQFHLQPGQFDFD